MKAIDFSCTQHMKNQLLIKRSSPWAKRPETPEHRTKCVSPGGLEEFLYQTQLLNWLVCGTLDGKTLIVGGHLPSSQPLPVVLQICCHLIRQDIAAQ